MDRASKSLLTPVIFALVMITLLIESCNHNKALQPPSSWAVNFVAVRRGNIVDIFERKRTEDAKPCRIVHITSMTNTLFSVSGHDYNMDGRWDRLYWCGYNNSTAGCNSYVLDSTGHWVYEPCIADVERAPIPEFEILILVKRLNEALKARRPEYINRNRTFNYQPEEQPLSAEQVENER